MDSDIIFDLDDNLENVSLDEIEAALAAEAGEAEPEDEG